MANGCGPKCGSERICPEGQQYVKKVLADPPKAAILACEGACIKGEVARVAANILAYKLERNIAVRICLGDAVIGDSGFTELVQRAPKTIIIEGCSLHCGNEIMKKRIPDLEPVIIEAIRLYSFDRDKYFEIFDIPREEIEEYAKKVADYVQQTEFQGKSIADSALMPGCGCCS